MFGMFGAFDPGFYPRISRQSVGRSIGFLLVFVLIISAAVSVKYTAVACPDCPLRKNGSMRICPGYRLNSLLSRWPRGIS